MEIRAAIAFGESFPEHSETVKSTQATTTPYTPTITVMGEVRAPKQVTLMSELPGRIEKVGFESGDLVSKDQVLLQLDISEQTALLAAANARLSLAQSLLKRNQQLFTRKAVSQERLDKAIADVTTIEAEIAQLNTVIRKKTIRAPFSGITGLHEFEVGQFMPDNKIVTHLVARSDYVWVDFSLPEFYPILETSSEVSIFTLDGHDSHSGRIVASSSQVSGSNRSIEYRATLANHSLLDRASVRVKVPVSKTQTLISLPLTALQHDHLGSYVFLLVEDEKTQSFRAKRLDVEVAATTDRTVLLSQGVEAGQLIATDGAFKLYSGVLTHRFDTKG